MIGAIIAGFGFLITSYAVWSCFRIMPCLKAEMRVLNAIFNKSLLSNLEDDWYQVYVVFDEWKVENTNLWLQVWKSIQKEDDQLEKKCLEAMD